MVAAHEMLGSAQSLPVCIDSGTAGRIIITQHIRGSYVRARGYDSSLTEDAHILK
jgi:hypothetical protein